MGKVEQLFPADDFCTVLENAGKEIESGLVIGYDKDGTLAFYGGGLLSGGAPVAKDFLWMVEAFRTELLAGNFH